MLYYESQSHAVCHCCARALSSILYSSGNFQIKSCCDPADRKEFCKVLFLKLSSSLIADSFTKNEVLQNIDLTKINVSFTSTTFLAQLCIPSCSHYELILERSTAKPKNCVLSNEKFYCEHLHGAFSRFSEVFRKRLLLFSRI